MYEVLTGGSSAPVDRRIRRRRRRRLAPPDLLVIDGGKGQLGMRSPLTDLGVQLGGEGGLE